MVKLLELLPESYLGLFIWLLIAGLLSLGAVFMMRFWKRVLSGMNLHPVLFEAAQSREIYTDLVELRAVADADRVYVFRFHNGVDFLPSNPAWKITCSHEVVKHGVTYEAAKLQGVLISLIPGIIGPLLSGTSNVAGVYIPVCGECPYKMKCLKENKRVVVIHVDDMEGSYTKFHLESQNIKTAVLCCISIDEVVLGLVGMDFCGARLQDDRIFEISQKLCRTTDKVRYHLQSKTIGKSSVDRL